MKDAKGHGSDGRGGSYPNIDKNLRGPGKHVGYTAGGDAWHIQKSNGPKSQWYSATKQDHSDSFAGKGLAAISAGLQQRGDAWLQGALGTAAQHGIPTDHLAPDKK